MKKISLALALLAALLLTACGGGSGNSSNVTGTWTATLANSAGVNSFVFKIDLNQAADNVVTGTNLTVTTGAPCWENIISDAGTFTAGGTFNGMVTNTLGMTIEGAEPGELGFNHLTLQGAVSGNTISGAWVLTGPVGACSGSGNFTMTR